MIRTDSTTETVPRYSVKPGLIQRFILQLWSFTDTDIYRGVVIDVRAKSAMQNVLTQYEYLVSWDWTAGMHVSEHAEWVSEDHLQQEEGFQTVIHGMTVIWKRS